MAKKLVHALRHSDGTFFIIRRYNGRTLLWTTQDQENSSGSCVKANLSTDRSVDYFDRATDPYVYPFTSVATLKKVLHDRFPGELTEEGTIDIWNMKGGIVEAFDEFQDAYNLQEVYN